LNLGFGLDSAPVPENENNPLGITFGKENTGRVTANTDCSEFVSVIKNSFYSSLGSFRR
jgi:hypothetical protein